MCVCASYAEEKGIGSLVTGVTGSRELLHVGARSGAQIVSKNRHFSPPTIYPHIPVFRLVSVSAVHSVGIKSSHHIWLLIVS